MKRYWIYFALLHIRGFLSQESQGPEMTGLICLKYFQKFKK